MYSITPLYTDFYTCKSGTTTDYTMTFTRVKVGEQQTRDNDRLYTDFYTCKSRTTTDYTLTFTRVKVGQQQTIH
jgi:hypothetical protein